MTIRLSAIATEDIKVDMLLIIIPNEDTTDMAEEKLPYVKPYRWGTQEYASAVARTDASEGERVIYEKLPHKIHFTNPNELKSGE